MDIETGLERKFARFAMPGLLCEPCERSDLCRLGVKRLPACFERKSVNALRCAHCAHGARLLGVEC